MGSSKNRPGILDTHEGHAEDGTYYVYKTPSHLKLGNPNNQGNHETYPPQPHLTPSRMTPEPCPYPDPSEASERSSLLPASLSSPPKKDDTKPAASSIYTERSTLSWTLCLAPAKKNSGVKPAEELEMREGIGLMREEASPCLEFGRGIGTGADQPVQTDSEAKFSLLATPSAF